VASARVISAQHPKNMGATIQTIEERPSPFEEARRVA